MNSKLFIPIVLLFTVGAVGMALAMKTPRQEPVNHVNTSGKTHELTVYKTPTCGCCGNWVNYMKAKDYDVEVIDMEDISPVKEQHGIPQELYSCHTTIVNDGEYFIEGHIPEEATVKLLEEEPDIAGIGMPGMPSASPGMGGSKMGPFEIYQVAEDGLINDYMSI